MINKLIDGKDFSHLVLVVLATFPKERFVTNRALAERMSQVGVSTTTSAVMQITSQFKRNFRDVYSGKNKGKRVKSNQLMETSPIKWKKAHFMKELIDAKEVLPSKRCRIYNAVRLNEQGRKKVIKIAEDFGCEEEVKNVLKIGLH